MPVFQVAFRKVFGERERGRRFWLVRLASLRLTLVIMITLGIGIVIAYWSETHTVWPLVLPLGLGALNLAAAVVTNGVFRKQLPILAFHLCLLALILLVAVGRMTYLKGHLELTEGAWFEGMLTAQESGPWHAGCLDEIRFTNLGFEIDYEPGYRRGPTRNLVAYLDQSGRMNRFMIGDQTPLVIQGYRFYTSHNKGFAPTFSWEPVVGGTPSQGSVHLPSYPLHEYQQAQIWQLPGSSRSIWIQLQFDELLLDPERSDTFELPKEHVLVVRYEEQRMELKPGGRIDLPEGRLRYLGVRSWMGYTVFYDWTIPWLFAASVAAVAALGWHFWRKFSSRPWDALQDQEYAGNTC